MSLTAGTADLVAISRLLIEEMLEPEPCSAPARFGEYELLGKLDEGGEGVVYKARDLKLGRMVALKRMREGDLADTVTRGRFLRGAKAAAKIDHPHVVSIHHVGEVDGEPFMAMKYMTGGTLRDAMKAPSNDLAEPKRAAELVKKLARAVHAGHDLNIIHRDLKPENILFDATGEPHVADFGVAKYIDTSGSVAPRTKTGDIVGTLYYMAPEQAHGEATAASDIWSLGVILYELLAGRRPFEGVTILELLRSAAEDEPDPLRGVPRDLATVCLTCLYKEPERRYISAEALARDLEHYLHNEPIEAVPPGRLTRTLRWCGRHQVAAALFGSAALVLVTLTLWAFASARAQEQARRAEVLATNEFAARAMAGTVLAQLEQYANIAAEEANDPRLANAIERGDSSALGELCAAAYARHHGGSSPVESWWILDATGALHAHVPALPADASVWKGNYAFRDYFHGAMAEPPHGRAYVSRAFRSNGDGRYKFAIASPILGEAGATVAVLVAGIATDRSFGNLTLSDDRRIVVLAGRRDREAPAEPLPDVHLVLVHDGVAQGEGVLLESTALRRLTARRDSARAAGQEQLRLPPPDWVVSEDGYRDPLDKTAPGSAGGAWLAGVAPVGGTELSVIVQTRLEDAISVDQRSLRVLVAWPVGSVALLFSFLLAVLRSRRVQRGDDRAERETRTGHLAIRPL